MGDLIDLSLDDIIKQKRKTGGRGRGGRGRGRGGGGVVRRGNMRSNRQTPYSRVSRKFLTGPNFLLLRSTENWLFHLAASGDSRQMATRYV